jgi:DNA-binding MarR family transcriptional regulator
LYIQIYGSITFVPTNFEITNMTIEEIIKSNSPMALSKKTVLNIMYTQNILSDKFSELLKPFDISSEQFNVLRILRGQKGAPANMCLIQERMLAKTSNTTRLVDKLLLKELVTREICLDNRRKMEIMITKKGINLLTALDPKVEAHENQFASNINQAELKQLNSLLEKFRKQ